LDEMMKKRPPLHCSLAEKLAFYSRVEANGCRVWIGSRCGRGYGRVFYDGRVWQASHLAFELAHGPLPEGKIACHTCDNPPCIEGEHLFAGTHADNAADKIAKGRQSRGQGHGAAKLTEEQALAITNDDRPQRLIARDFGVAQSTVSFIKTGQRWQHLAVIG
jgi:hypothetical protein